MSPHAPTHYQVALADVNAHVFEVRCDVHQPASDGQRFRLPTWVPGSYLIREFARHFVDVRGESDGKSVAVAKEAKDAWRAAPCAGPLTIVARIYAFDLSVRTAYLDARRAYFNGGALFLCPEGRESETCTLEIILPQREPFLAWRCATTLPRSGDGLTFRADNYDALIDHPVELSDFTPGEFVAGGIPHELAIAGRHDADLPRLERDLARVCQWQADLFGSSPPFSRYLFQVMAVGEGYGGLEHRSSTSLLASRNGLPAPGMEEPSDAYVNFLGLASHEYFHAWNVKRIKPAAFTPYDLSREGYTRQLWAFEGITSYYDDLALVRSGVITASKYLELVGRVVTSVLRTPGRHVQSVSASSFDAWIKFYRPDDNSPNAGVSYYLKGSLVALALDLLLRSEARATLDDVMRLLWRRYGEPGVGVPEAGIPAAVAEVAGRDVGEFFARYVDGTEDPPLAELFASHGIMLDLRRASGPTDRGGKPAAAGTETRNALGVKLGNDLRLQHVFSGGPAEVAGLAPGDTLVALDGVRASQDAVAGMLERLPDGARIVVHAFRRDELMTFALTLAAAPLDTAFLTIDAAASTESRRRQSAWLGTPEPL